jgi:uncharacterized membrane protein YuzA (DUF378 family)
MDTPEKTKEKDIVSWVGFVLLIIGGLNWGLVGLIKLDVVQAIFGDMTVLARIIYLLVGISAIYMLLMPPKLDKK